MKRGFKILLINLLILTTLLALLESILRLKGDNYTWSEKSYGVYYDPWGVNLSEPLQIRSLGEHRESYEEFTYHMEVNSNGVRDKEHEVAKAENTIRIVGLGDSFMEGMGTVLDSTILSRMGAKLNSLSTDARIEMISGGVSGSDIFRGYNLLSLRLMRYEPDYTVILFNNTDVNDWLLKGDEVGARPAIPMPSKTKQTLFKYSHLYRSISIKIFKSNWLQQSAGEQQESWQLFKADFEKVIVKYNQLLGKTDRILLVFHPLVAEYQQTSYYYPFDELEAILSKHGIQTLDVMDCLEAKGAQPSDIYWPIDQHFNARGYGLVADCIVESGFVKP